MKLVAQPLPLLPQRLKVFLETHRHEYGTARDVGTNMPPSTQSLWSIENDTGVCTGYSWLDDHLNRRWNPGWFWSAAVFEEHQGQGCGSFALLEIERELRKMHIAVIRTQVNNNEPESGLRVRRWLLANGYVPEVEASDLRATLPAAEYSRVKAGPVFLVKHCAASGETPQG